MNATRRLEQCVSSRQLFHWSWGSGTRNVVIDRLPAKIRVLR